MNRFRLLSVFAALAVTALIASGCGGDDNKTSTSSADAQQQLISALKNTSAVKTGDLQMDGEIGFTGGQANVGNVTFKGGGPFDVSDPKNPAMDLEIEFGVAGQSQKIGVIVVDGKTYIEFAGQAIELDESSAGSVGDLTDTLGPNSIGSLAKNFEDNVENVQKVSTKKVGDTELVVYSADIDFAKAIESLSGEDGKNSLFEGLSGQNAEQLKESFQAKTVEFGVEEADNVVRSVTLEADIKDPSGKDEGTGTIKLSVQILEADGPVEIKAPENAIKGGGAGLGNVFGGVTGQ
jgi:hypothetical protein